MRCRSLLFPIFCAALLTAQWQSHWARAAAQSNASSAASQPGADVNIRVNTTLVLIPVTVTDSLNRFVLGLDKQVGSLAPGKAADLCVWRIESLAELGYWIGLPGPERRIFNGADS